MLGALLRLVPGWGWLALLGVGLATMVGGHLHAVHQARVQGRAEVQARWEADLRARDELAARDLLRRTNNQLEAHRAYQKQAQAAAAAASAARADADGLRELLAARDAASAAAGGGADEAGVLRQLLAECVGAYQGVAAEADRLLAKVAGLQGYVAGVCLEDKP